MCTIFIGPVNASRSEVEVYIKLSRQYLYHVTQSFFQSWLLGFLAYLTFWVDLEDFNDRLAYEIIQKKITNTK